MSGWWIIVLVLFGGVAGAAAILLYHSRMPDLQRSASRSPSAPPKHAFGKRVAPRTVARSLHTAIAIAGVGGFLLATDRTHRGLGEAVVGLTAVSGFLVSLWLKYLKKQPEDR